MKLRPEFELLDNQFRQLYANKGVDSDFLSTVEIHIRLCEHIADENIEGVERRVITRTKYWWQKRLLEIKEKIEAENEPPRTVQEKQTNQSKYEVTENDRRFLRSLRISSEGPPLQDNDDGA